jgi:hypothetical protein
MKAKQIYLLVACLPLFLMGCDKTTLVEPEPNTGLNLVNDWSDSGATQIDGIGYYAEVAECDYPGEGADFALLLTGDLEGCLYAFVDSYDCSPSGTYREEGREYFVGTYNGASGTFWTTYKFQAKFEGCAEDGSFIGAEIFGRCQHPIESGSGTGGGKVLMADWTGAIQFVAHGILVIGHEGWLTSRFLLAERFCSHPQDSDKLNYTRLDFKDYIESRTFPYRGHLRY